MGNNNCYVKKQMCKAHNHPSPSPASICYANKGGMCVPLQQAPGWISSVSGQCWATMQQCQQHLPSGGGDDKKSKGERQCNRCLKSAAPLSAGVTTGATRQASSSTRAPTS